MIQERVSPHLSHDSVRGWIVAVDSKGRDQVVSCRYLTRHGWSPPQPEGGYVPIDTVLHATRGAAEAALRANPPLRLDLA